MRSDLRRRWSQFSDAMAECRRADEHWSMLKSEGVAEVAATLGEKEARHLSHTVFRINALLFLYSRLRGTEHETHLGVVLGAITHLLDYVYDHHAKASGAVASFEGLVYSPHRGQPQSALDRVLRRLCTEAWESVADPFLLRAHLDAMLDTQRASMAQDSGTTLSGDALWRLTRAKGHRSLCLFFAAVNSSFDSAEAAALEKLGLYMQYMDDLEDYYEDRSETRVAPIPNPWTGSRRATRLLFAAAPDLRRYYGSTSLRGYRIFMSWLSVFHAGILLACATRELTRRLPERPQTWIDRFTERLARRNPFFHVAPVGLTYCDSSRTDRPARAHRARSLAATIPPAAVGLWVNAHACASAFGTVIDPVLEATVTDPRRRREIRPPLFEWALKGAYMLGAYTRLAGLPAENELAMLCGAAGRLYDDLLEDTSSPSLAARVTELFEDGSFIPEGDLERLLAALYVRIRDRLARERSDPVFKALADLHHYQCRTEQQRDVAIPQVMLDEITFRKGGLTLQVLYSMARPNMPPEEQALVRLIGGTLQLLDDYQDESRDRSAGLTTKATRGQITVRQLLAQLGRLENELAPYYGSAQAARFVNKARVQLGIAWLGRHAGVSDHPRRRQIDNAGPFRSLIKRGGNVPVESTAPSRGTVALAAMASQSPGNGAGNGNARAKSVPTG